MDWIFITQLTLASFIGSFFCALTATGDIKSVVANAGIQIVLSVGISLLLQDMAYKHISKDNMLAFGTALILGTLSPKELKVYAKNLISYAIKKTKK